MNFPPKKSFKNVDFGLKIQNMCILRLFELFSTTVFSRRQSCDDQLQWSHQGSANGTIEAQGGKNHVCTFPTIQIQQIIGKRSKDKATHSGSANCNSRR